MRTNERYVVITVPPGIWRMLFDYSCEHDDSLERAALMLMVAGLNAVRSMKSENDLKQASGAVLSVFEEH